MAFKGCIKDVQLGTLAKDLNENKEFKDVSPGCTEVVSSNPSSMLSSSILILVFVYCSAGLFSTANQALRSCSLCVYSRPLA